MKIYFKLITKIGNTKYYIITYNINEINIDRVSDVFIVTENYIYHNNENKLTDLDDIKSVNFKSFSDEEKNSFIDKRFSEVMINFSYEKINSNDEINKIEELFNIINNQKSLLEPIEKDGLFFNSYKNILK
jgi:hypothetical protein